MLKWALSMIFFLSLVNLTCVKIKGWNIGIEVRCCLYILWYGDAWDIFKTIRMCFVN
jgi:hypothetical protein